MPLIKTYQHVENYLESGRDISLRRIEDNTYAVRGNSGQIAVRYYSTDIVTFWQDGRIILNSGGFRTATTKRRICEYSPATVYQRDFTWYVMQDSTWNAPIPFHDGMDVSGSRNVPPHCYRSHGLPL